MGISAAAGGLGVILESDLVAEQELASGRSSSRFVMLAIASVTLATTLCIRGDIGNPTQSLSSRAGCSRNWGAIDCGAV